MEKELISESFSEDVNIKESVLIGLRAQNKIPKKPMADMSKRIKKVKEIVKTMTESEKKIYVTRDYNIFKVLVGNRAVLSERVLKITRSIVQHGYITNPLIVNENMEVIDGQGRLQALRALHLPVEYIIQPGLDVDDCIAMNVITSNWKPYDYIASYAELGDENYIRIKKLFDTYWDLGAKNIYQVLGLYHKSRYGATGSIKSGSCTVSEEQYDYAKNILEETHTYLHMTKSSEYDRGINGKGTKTAFFSGIIWILMHVPNIDKDRLYKVLNEKHSFMMPFVNIETCVESIGNLYNKGLRNKINFSLLLAEVKNSTLFKSKEEEVEE